MKRILLVIFALISLNAFSQLQVKEGSFKYLPGGVIEDKETYTDGNESPMALIKISTENIPEQERMRLVFTGNRETQILKVPKTGQMWIYISAEAATFIDIKHPDYGTYKYYLPEKLCDYCKYEMVLQYVQPKTESNFGILSVISKPAGADVYIDDMPYGKTTCIIKELAAGTYVLKLKKDNYETIVKDIEIKQGVMLKLNEELSYKKYVDLVLSVKWATCNVGAERPEKYGEYYAWGEISAKESYSYTNCNSYSYRGQNISGNAQYDVATATMGEGWRMPTDREYMELECLCTWMWTQQNGVNGYKVTSKKNGNSIFLPAAGYSADNVYSDGGGCGYYWIAVSSGYRTARYWLFDSAGFIESNLERYCGLSVRAVFTK